MAAPELAIIVPAYNEASRIEATLEELSPKSGFGAAGVFPAGQLFVPWRGAGRWSTPTAH